MSNTAFNAGNTSWTHKKTEHNFKNFLKNNKKQLTFLHLIIFIAFIIITVTLNQPVKELLYEFVWSNFATFQFGAFFSKLFNYSALVQFSKISANEQLFKNYQIILFGATIVLTIDLAFLVFDFFERRRRFNYFKKTEGLYVYPNMDKWCKDIIKSIIDCAVFIIKACFCWLFLSFAIFDSLLAYNIFEHNFFLCVLQFSFVVWVFVSGLIMYNYYDWYKEYYLSFVKFPRYECFKEGISFLMPKLILECFLTLLSFFIILVSLPYDLFLIYFFLKHFVTKRINEPQEYTREPQTQETNIQV